MNDALLIRDDIDGVCKLTLNRPDAYNSLSMELMQALIAELDAIAGDSTVRVVVLKGSGRGFCSGHDLKQMMGEGEEDYYQCTFDTCSQLMQRIVNLPIPVIAQVHGVATAAGCQLVASCDLAVASDKSRFATPGVNIGLFCSTPMVALSRAVSKKHAMEMLLLGDMISAAKAAEIGLVNWVVADELVEQKVDEVAGKIAASSRKAVSIGKQAYVRQIDKPLDEAYAECSRVMTDNMLTHDAGEGIDAFINKRKPCWQHR
ncbi:enoyl-CoA hydratase [Amphritea sp. 2_MG-2023]|uniref:enoyl-CoA hydratase n=1 Tax=Amphritea TaxID=515417 RepID=UPI001C06654E|nr:MULTISPECIES: enoyl-CoA hydratase [Amphritea]MBU2964320.1 enoyl-CoA hydratase [Amphritea atlantica]MDO6419422.1 enoyl-CoA hydratase [Amphritea sp. 2_MG-2023]MDX2422633.1 enoyl-CoA hydratase [Amphritea sp.]